MIRFAATAVLVLAAATATPALAQTAPPYWASIAAGQARMRTGPGRNFPATWLYQRAGLPVRVVATYPAWRKIEDPDGTQGWMQANLLAERRTAMVRGEVRPLRAAPDAAAEIVWNAEPGVTGEVSRCEAGWCLLDAGQGRRGFVEAAALWGVDENEELD